MPLTPFYLLDSAAFEFGSISLCIKKSFITTNMSSSTDPTLLAGLGCALAVFLCGLGAAYGTGHASIFALRHNDTWAMAPVVIAGVLAVYGIIVAFLIQSRITDTIATKEAHRFLTAGLSVGLACLASGLGMGRFLKQCNASELYFVRKGKAEPHGSAASKKFSLTPFVLCLIYLEAIGLYGLIIALLLVGFN